MILVLKNNKIFATHDDWQDVLDKYPHDYTVIQIDDMVIKPFLAQYESLDESPDPRELFPYIDLRQVGTIQQRIADIEDALAQILGSGLL